MVIAILLVAVGLSSTKYEHEFHWQETPTLIVCEDSGFTRDDIEASVSFWRDQGYDFDMIIYRDPCETHTYQGAIVLAHDKYRLSSVKSFGTTFIDHNETSINYANVWIKRRHIGNRDVITSSIGHSLGIARSPVEGNIMNSHKVIFHDITSN